MTPVKAYCMGIRAKVDGLNETFNPFRNQGLQRLYHQAWWRGLNV